MTSMTSSGAEPVTVASRAVDDFRDKDENYAYNNRMAYALEHGLWTDCSFSVGRKETKEFKCHRCILAIASPVFESMLFGPLSENELFGIRVPDIEPSTFQCVLSYIYHDLVELPNIEISLDLLYAAKKYLLHPKLISRCLSTAIGFIAPCNVYLAAHFAAENNEETLEHKAIMCLLEYPRECIANEDAWNELSEHVLLQLVLYKKNNLTEIELYSACVKWSQQQLVKQNKKVNATSIKKCMDPFLPHIRFFKMAPREFILGPAHDEIFSKEVEMAILSKLIVPEIPFSISNVCNEQRLESTPYGPTKISCPTCGSTYNQRKCCHKFRELEFAIGRKYNHYKK